MALAFRPPEKLPRLRDYIDDMRGRRKRKPRRNLWFGRRKKTRFRSKHVLSKPGFLGVSNPLYGFMQGRWRRRCLGMPRYKSYRPKMGRLRSWRQYQDAVRRFHSHVQIEIAEQTEDGLFQLSPFYGDPDHPRIYSWARCICSISRDRLMHHPAMTVSVLNTYGEAVELRWSPIRFVFASRTEAMMFLLRNG